jgi:site-specific DNA-methyltransferase (adenine-specific)/modification methylase
MSRIETIGNATLYLGDCREILPTLPKVDAVVTDPPYGVGIPYLSFNDTESEAAGLINQVISLCAPAASRVLVFSEMTLLWSLPKPDWICAWAWVSTGSYGKRGVNQWQPLLMYGDDIAGFGAVNGVIKSDFKYFNDGIGTGFLAEKVDHPCPKIPKVMEWCVQRFSNMGDSILDPLMGSGTTGVAAIKMGRRFIGIEIEPKYFDIACRRIDEATQQPDMFIEQPKPVQQSLELTCGY